MWFKLLQGINFRWGYLECFYHSSINLELLAWFFYPFLLTVPSNTFKPMADWISMLCPYSLIMFMIFFGYRSSYISAELFCSLSWLYTSYLMCEDLSFRVRKNLKDYVGDVDVAAVPCGFGRAIGNKVCQRLRFQLFYSVWWLEIISVWQFAFMDVKSCLYRHCWSAIFRVNYA